RLHEGAALVGIPAADRRERHDDARHRPAGNPARPSRRLSAAARACVIAVAAALLVPAAAAAQVPTPTPTPTVTPTPTPTPVPTPVAGNLRLKIEKTYRDTGRHIAFTRDSWRVRGEMRPYVAGQTVTIRFFRQGK